MSIEQRQSEFYVNAHLRNQRARELRQEGWTVSIGQMRREDGRDYYVRMWRAVLVKLAPRTNVDESGGHCWCSKNLTDDSEPHDQTCQRTRIFMGEAVTIND